VDPQFQASATILVFRKPHRFAGGVALDPTVASEMQVDHTTMKSRALTELLLTAVCPTARAVATFPTDVETYAAVLMGSSVKRVNAQPVQKRQIAMKIAMILA
jgi:hypothetical protein